ncbi:MAG: helix-turn-helix transcriptional regulator [Candidatus Acidiferrum sp.]
MIIGERLRVLREERNLSQGDIEKKTGLLRCYLSRVENGHTVPALETLEKLARALDMSLYQVLYDGDQPPRPDVPASWTESGKNTWGSSGKELRFMRKLRHLLSKMEPEDRSLLMFTVQQMVKRKQAPSAGAATAKAAAAPEKVAAAATSAD